MGGSSSTNQANSPSPPQERLTLAQRIGVVGLVGGVGAYAAANGAEYVAGLMFAEATAWQVFLIGGGIFLGVCFAGYGIYRAYQMYQDSLSVHERLLNSFSEEQLKNLVEKDPKWKPVQISADEMQHVKEITLQKLKQKIARYVCPITGFVPREPYETPCLHNFQKMPLIRVITKTQQCPVCRRKVKLSQLKDGFQREDAILALRLQIKKCYPSLTEADKAAWKAVVQQGMGPGYLEKDL